MVSLSITVNQARVRYTDEQISQRHAALAQAQTYRNTLADRLAGLDERLMAAQAELAAARAIPGATAADRAAVNAPPATTCLAGTRSCL
jgi:hypothetical protein